MNLAVSGYKINTQKSLAFLYTNNEKSERQIKESVPFITATKTIKYLGINLLKETKELYTENYKTLMKEIRDDKRRHILCSWIVRINSVNITILPNVIYRFNEIHIKLPMAFFTELEQNRSEIIWEHKRPQITKSILRKMNGTGGTNLPNFRLYYKATVINTVWYWHETKI